ncbi:MAG: DUF928 domain-containing protein [Cyanobacteria bacterium P01_D01_bin.50]
MRQRLIASTLGFALIAGGAWIPSQRVSAVMFSSPDDNSAPSEATGGASRSGIFTRISGESAPSEATGGASRSGIFTRISGESAPSEAIGGASRSGIFTRKSGESAPRGNHTTGGASRNGDNQPAAIMALLPQTYFGTTVYQRPEILVYLPQSEAKGGVFSLKDAKGNTLHEMTVPVSGKAGIISIKIPKDLKIEKSYQWFLALKMDGQLSPRTPYVDGWIKRIQPNKEITRSMQEKDLLNIAKTFGKEGVWYDCVATLASLRAAQPDNSTLKKHWSELLESVGLQDLDKASLIALNNISN